MSDGCTAYINSVPFSPLSPLKSSILGPFFFLLLTSVIPLSHSHRLVPFRKYFLFFFFYITQSPPLSNITFGDKPQFILMQRQAENQVVEGWSTAGQVSCGTFFSSDTLASHRWEARGLDSYSSTGAFDWGLIKVRLDKHVLSLFRCALGHLHKGDDQAYIVWAPERILGLFMAHSDGWK